ncbi:cardiolipin synthase ClsB [Algiphilus aromaticivorans]|uniref:cardiolipin synthase ClsB n=1 Tax=Algiphilus aromaticivorans TaxID=382454 RepID=UPI000A06F854|nr:cardiolipin synthase ClsB [Algiphilus aromaticivorans]
MNHPHDWSEGNTLTLLENGEMFFPAVFADIRAAREEVILETFIWLDDAIGRALREALLEAASHGASVDVTVDGHGSATLGKDFIKPLTDAGVRLHVFGPMPPKLGMQPNLLHRLHRKIVVVDQRIAHVGGINFSDAHMYYYGAESKQDYSVRVEGPAVDGIRAFCAEAIGASMNKRRSSLRRLMWRVPTDWMRPRASAQALFVTRDNDRHRHDIEAVYLMGLRSARRDIIIMNSYFFPSQRFLRAMRQAVQRGARLRLVLQGNPDKGYVKFAGQTLYDYLLDMGVEIWEYTERPSHAKVAVVDDAWATVGSSNLDPFSLSLNLEANLVIRDSAFNRALRASLEHLLRRHARRVERVEVARRHPLWRVWRWLAFHLLRYFPRLARLFPVKTSRVATIEQPHSDLGSGERRIGHVEESRD